MNSRRQSAFAVALLLLLAQAALATPSTTALATNGAPQVTADSARHSPTLENPGCDVAAPVVLDFGPALTERLLGRPDLWNETYESPPRGFSLHNRPPPLS